MDEAKPTPTEPTPKTYRNGRAVVQALQNPTPADLPMLHTLREGLRLNLAFAQDDLRRIELRTKQHGARGNDGRNLYQLQRWATALHMSLCALRHKIATVQHELRYLRDQTSATAQGEADPKRTPGPAPRLHFEYARLDHADGTTPLLWCTAALQKRVLHLVARWLIDESGLLLSGAPLRPLRGILRQEQLMQEGERVLARRFLEESVPTNRAGSCTLEDLLDDAELNTKPGSARVTVKLQPAAPTIVLEDDVTVPLDVPAAAAAAIPELADAAHLVNGQQSR